MQAVGWNRNHGSANSNVMNSPLSPKDQVCYVVGGQASNRKLPFLIWFQQLR